jgi:hypothetical protein
LDTIKSALSKLPTEELTRLGVDLHQEFISGTENGNLLIEVWNKRQAEVKQAVDGMMKPAEFMRDIMNILQNTTDEAILIRNLVVLESLLADIDNSRDFHTIGGWPVILGLLRLNNSLEIRSHASWCIGTAVKNDYDFQLWIFEEVVSAQVSTSGLVLLLQNLEDSVNFFTNEHSGEDSERLAQQHYGLTKRVLYALASCLRGNMDVQEIVLSLSSQSSPSANHLSHLLLTLATHSLGNSILSSNQNQLVVLRKIWSLISDMVDELAYLREGLISEIILSRQSQGSGNRIEDSLESQIKEATQQIHPLGELFLTKDPSEDIWLPLARSILLDLTNRCLVEEEVAPLDSGDRPVLSPTPTASGNMVPSTLKFSDSCPIFVSSPLRSVYESVANSFKLIKKFSSVGHLLEDRELETRVDSLANHPTLE